MLIASIVYLNIYLLRGIVLFVVRELGKRNGRVIRDWISLLRSFVVMRARRLRTSLRKKRRRGNLGNRKDSNYVFIFRIVNAVSGALVDVRDEDHIWQKGRIIRTFNRLNNEHNRIKFLVVQYL